MKRSFLLAVISVFLFPLISHSDWQKIERFPDGFDNLVFDESRGMYIATRDQELWQAKGGEWSKTGTILPDTVHRFLVYDRRNGRIVLIARKDLLRKGNRVRSKYYYVWDLNKGSFIEKGSTKGLKSINEQNVYQAFYCDTINQVVIIG